MRGTKYICKITCSSCGTGYGEKGPLNLFIIKGSKEQLILCDECEEQINEEDSEGEG